MNRSNRNAFLVSRILTLIIAATVIITIFIGWDIRRLSASRIHAAGFSATTPVSQVQALADAQARAPERPLFTNKLFTEYFHAAIYHYDHGNETEAIQLMLTSRELLLNFEKYDPFKRDTQINLFQAEIALTQWGYYEYSEQAVERSKKIVQQYASYPSLISMIATNMTLIGMHDLAIEYAERAINTESITKPWAKAWYAKGRALYHLGQTEAAITILTTATTKNPGTEGSVFAHKLLAKIYGEEGQSKNSELSEFHKQKGDQTATVQD